MSIEREYVVVIPVYKTTMTKFELTSFIQALEVFQNQIVVIHPKGLDLSEYKKIANQHPPHFDIEYRPFPANYFNDIFGYNELLLDRSFYDQFLEYSHMLIYQLDAYMFHGDFNQVPDVDYIGAPVFEGFSKATELKYTGHQNGGLSLRNIKKSAFACAKAKTVTGIFTLYRKRYLGKKDVLRIVARKIGILGQACQPYHWEDMFFSFAAPMLVDDFVVASYEQSYQFSFDCLPEKLYELNHFSLPMGCHAFHKGTKWDFWSKYIHKLGDKNGELEK